MMGQDNAALPKQAGQTVPWRYIGIAFAISIASTTVLGGALFILQQNVWWLTVGGLLSLFGAGVYLGWQSREPEPLYGVLLALLYFGLVLGILFGGQLAEGSRLALPDPLPGLAIGDSTFFFVLPLLMLFTSVAGSVLGGRWRNPDR